MGQKTISLPTSGHPSEQSACYSSTQGDNIPLDIPNLSSDQFESPPSQVSSQESALGTYQHCTNKIRTKIVDAPEFTEYPQTPEVQNPQNFGDDRRPRRWPCPYDSCNRTYGRPRDVIRHIKAGHQPQHNCPFPFCHTTWNRAELIRHHIADRHRGELTEEKLQELLSIRTKEGTIRFLEALQNYAAGIMGQSGEATLVNFESKWDQRRSGRRKKRK